MPTIAGDADPAVAFGFPFAVSAAGRVEPAPDGDAVLRSRVLQVLFTAPGERVNRPTFGSGVMQLVFAPNNDALAAATQLTVQGALQQWLGDLIVVEAVEAENDGATLRVLVQYTVRQTQQRRVAQFTREVPS